MNKPRLPLHEPHRRHNALTVGQKTLARAWNTVYLPNVDVQADTDAINAGEAERIAGQWHINNRIYGEHDGTLYPIEGDGLIRMGRSVFKAFVVYNTFGDTAHAESILDAIGFTDEVRNDARRAWEALQAAMTVSQQDEEKG